MTNQTCQPTPCAWCGVNFMIHRNKKLCNSCELKENAKKGVKTVSKINVVIELESSVHAKIEEICMNLGMDFTEYFLMLHNERLIKERGLEESGDTSRKRRKKEE